MVWLICFWLLLFGFVQSKDNILSLGGLYSSRTQLGRSVKVAATLALRHINDNQTVLPGYQLEVDWTDTKCDMAIASQLVFDMMYNTPKKVMLFGDACTNVTAPIAETSRYWNIWQLSYADTDSILSNRDAYPYFYRTVPSDTDFNPARLKFADHFRWTKLGALYQDASCGSSRYSDAYDKLVKLFNSRNSNDGESVIESASFSNDPMEAIENLKSKDIRIILCNFDVKSARKVLCYAWKQGMYGAKYVWMLLGEYPDGWWNEADDTSCTREQLRDVLDGYFATDILPLSKTEELTIAGITAGEYEAIYNRQRGSAYSKYHGYAYDGIWVIALALHDVIEKAKNAGRDVNFWGGDIGVALNATNFVGVTGRVQFNKGDRIGNIVYRQLQYGVMRTVGEYTTSNKEMNLTKEENVAIRWRGHRPPRDKTLTEHRLVRVKTTDYVILCSIAGIGIIIAITFLAINIRFRKHKYIKMSSPNMNNVITVGCILIYLSVFLLGADGGLVSSSQFPIMCVARSWVLSFGFTLSFGAMFSKTWRVHDIFTNIKRNKKMITDYKLFLMVAFFLFIDCMILIAWQILDPPKQQTKQLQPEVDPEHDDKAIIPIIEFCISEHMTMWLVAIYTYKGLLMVFGGFLAWETRHVNIPALNDSKYIGMSVYNVVIICIAGVAVSSVIKDQPNSAYLIIAHFIIFCTTITLCFVFVPKILELRRDPVGKERRNRATLRKASTKHEESTNTNDSIQSLTADNGRYKQILEEKIREIDELVRQLGDDNSCYDTPTKPANRHVVTVTLEAGQASGSSDGDSSPMSTSSTPISCHADIAGNTYRGVPTESPEHNDDIVVTHERNRCRKEHVRHRPSRLAETSQSQSNPNTKDEDEKRLPDGSRQVRTPSYQGLKFLNVSLTETEILSDADTVGQHSPKTDRNDEKTASSSKLLTPNLT